MKLKLVSIMTISLIVALAGCARTAPIYSVNEAPVVVTNTGYNLTDMKNAILRAGTSLGWQMQPVDEHNIIGTLNVRKHMAQVDINYDRSNYSINYRDSRELNYDGSKIHSNYNGWVQRLDQAIKTQLISL